MNVNHTILCADDDPDDLQMLHEAIQSIDGRYRIIEAGDGTIALAQLSELRKNNTLPCLIVLDINMPKMDGKQTFLRIKNDPELSFIPVVIFSTSSSNLDKIFFARENVEYITKPIQYPHLLSVANKLLSYCRERRENE
ncbi:MAG TPA: response regulator [Flavisolibacter sp.]|nr:response regulator [Flavisolibacter sp.]